MRIHYVKRLSVVVAIQTPHYIESVLKIRCNLVLRLVFLSEFICACCAVTL
jgi:hypothetical protein